MMQTENLMVRRDGPAKLDIEIKSDGLLIYFTFMMKSRSCYSGAGGDIKRRFTPIFLDFDVLS